MKKIIVFDIGGVLAYDIWENLFREGIYRKYNIDLQNLFKVGQHLWQIFSTRNDLEPSTLEEEYWKLFIQKTRLEVEIRRLIHMTNNFIVPVPGMQNLVQDLYSKGHTLGICSNNTEFWYQKQMLRLHYIQYFDPSIIALSNRVGYSKSDNSGAMYKTIIKKTKNKINDIIFVDDREENITKALEYGIHSVLFPSHSSSGHQYLRDKFHETGVI